MAEITVQFRGTDNVVKNYKEYVRKKRGAAERATKKVGFMIEGDAKRRCPVKTNRLRSSISTNWSKSGLARGKITGPAKEEDGVGRPKGYPFTVVIGTNVFYAKFIETGTKKMSAKPYLHPAFHKNLGELQKTLKAEFNKK